MRTGKLQWLFDLTPLASSPFSGVRSLGAFVVDRTTVYAWTEQGDLLALDRDSGSLKWLAAVPTTTRGINYRYSALADGTLVVGSLDGHLEGRNPATGEVRWSLTVSRGSLYGPAASDSTSAYFPIAGGHLVVVAARTGTIRWKILSETNSLGLSGTPGVDSALVYMGGSNALFAFRR